MAVWTIQGEAGKPLDATVRNLGDLGAVGAVLSFRSLGTDTATIQFEVDDHTSTTNMPELSQLVTLYRDGVKFFNGFVSSNPFNLSGKDRKAQVVVSGPWWYMEQVPLVYPKADGTGATADRISTQFSSQDHRTNIQAVINRGIIAGIPMQLGTVSTYFDIPRITLNQMTVAQSLSEMIRLVPDAMTWFDYSTTPPTLNVTRRGSATTRTITLGTDDVTAMRISPVLQLKLEQIRLPYVTRATNGRTRYLEQSAGSSALGKVGIVTVSGPELDTYLPDENYEQATILTTTTGGIASDYENIIKQTDPIILGLRNKYGENWAGGFVTGSTGWQGVWKVAMGEDIPYHTFTPTGGETPSVIRTVAPTFTNPATGANVTGHLVWPSIDLPEWAIMQLGAVKVNFNYFDYVTLDWRTGNTQPNIPGIGEYKGSAGFIENAFNVFGSSYGKRSIFYRPWTVSAYVIQTSYPAYTTIYKPSDYAFFAPTANLASNLLAAQNWVPYEGTIDLIGDEVGGTRYRGCKVNVAGSIASHASMGALVESEDLDLMAGTTTINLGAPPRIDYKTFVDKIRRTPQDNIYYI